MKNIIVLMTLSLILIAGLSGCGGGPSTTLSTTQTAETASAEPITVTLSFPDGAPRLNQTAIFKCTVTSTRAVDKNMSININANSSAFVLESGSLTWSGTVPANSEQTVIEATFKAYHTGHWQIDANYHIDTQPDNYGGDFTSTIYVNLGIPSSEWGTTPPWEK
jgi:hypothetical protein